MKNKKKKDRSEIPAIIVRLSDEDRADFNKFMAEDLEDKPGKFAEKIIRRWLIQRKNGDGDLQTQLTSIMRALEKLQELPRGSLSGRVPNDPAKQSELGGAK